jgi:hypothetical protein
MIKYKKKRKYKYVMEDDYPIDLDIQVIRKADLGKKLILKTNGSLLIKRGYAWDGASGPTIDTPNFMRGSLVHDALYQLMREGCIDRDTQRDAADRILRDICREDGMSKIRSGWVYLAVKLFGRSSAEPDLKTAP